MTLQAWNPLTYYWWTMNSAPALNTVTMDATTDRCGLVFQAPKAGDLDRIEINIAAITTWPTGGVQVGWQGVTNTAAPVIPNGTYTHSVTVTVSPGAGWWNPGSFVDGGAAKRTVTRGELLSYALTPVSGTTSFTINRLDDASTAPNGQVGNFPVFVYNTSGSYAASPDAMCLALFYSGESTPVFLHPVILPVVSLTAKTISNANPDYGGLIFQVPSSCKTSGAYLRIDPDEITSIVLCTSDATAPLATAVWDKDQRSTTGSGAMYVVWDTEVTLSINTNYRIVCVNTGSATTCGITVVTIPSADYRSAHPMGITGNWTQSDNGTSWAETTTEVPLIQPTFSAFDDAVGGGGGGGLRIAGHGGIGSMSSYYGDIRLGDTIDIKFTTRRFSTGATFTLAGTPAISAYPGNSTTELTAGITLTVDFDSRTGLNNVRVVASSGNGYATATNYELVITAGTVDSVSVVGESIGSFSIENRSALMPTTAARTLDVSAGGEAGVDWANVGSPTTVVGLSGTTVKTATDVETDTADIQSRLPAALVGGRMDSNMGAISSDATAADNLEAALDGTGGVTITAAITGNITGNLSGSVGSVTAGVTVAVGGIATTSFAAGAIDAAAIAANAIGASELAQDAAREIADEILDRDLAGGASGGTRGVRNALRSLRNRAAIAAGTLTVYQEDDSTAAWTAAVTTTAGDPISQIDPAGP